ncbi:MAG: transposase, partial [Campylobacterota bacterium]
KCLFQGLYKDGVNRDLFIFDDSGCKILEGNPALTKQVTVPELDTNDNDGNKYKKQQDEKNPIKGYASIFACQNINGSDTIVLSFFSFQHAGQNLMRMLGDRDSDLPQVIGLSDALKTYIPYKKDTIDCLCNTHSRRYFIGSYEQSEDWISLQVLLCYRDLYKEEAYCKKNNLSAEERLSHHKLKSTKLLDRIENLCNFALLPPDDNEQIEKMRAIIEAPAHIFPVEPKTALGKAANYFLNHSKKLRMFLEIRGVPLDTNLAEQLEKSFIAIRKRSLFFKTIKSAEDAGYIDSLMLTAEVNGHNPFEYFSFIHLYKEAAMKNPGSFLPLNYKINPLYPKFRSLFSMALGNRPLADCHSLTEPVPPGNSS